MHKRPTRPGRLCDLYTLCLQPWCSEIVSLTSLQLQLEQASSDVREAISLHLARAADLPVTRLFMVILPRAAALTSICQSRSSPLSHTWKKGALDNSPAHLQSDEQKVQLPKEEDYKEESLRLNDVEGRFSSSSHLAYVHPPPPPPPHTHRETPTNPGKSSS